MKISYNWLREYAPIEASPEELAEILTMGGLEVENVARHAVSLEGIVVGRVLEVATHPRADRLTLCSVDVGAGHPLQVVCGAPNVAAGVHVPVATLGATVLMPSRNEAAAREPTTIRKISVLGEVSEGMICSESELGLSDDHSGILVLGPEARVGRSLVDYLRERGEEPPDAVLDVAVTPNRPDAAGHIGVARDVSAISGTPLRIPDVPLPVGGLDAARQISVGISAPDACPRYVAMLVRGVRVADSPAWLKRRLKAIGLRPRNNVVDVTNFVLHESGQPLHAFDLDELAGATIRVRLTDGESRFTTLDGQERALPAGTLMICDGAREVAIAGVMGGENSEVTEKTTNVLIESAYFDPASIRRTARALGLQTDSSYRFERGVDRDGQLWAAARAAQLVVQVAGGEIVPGAVDAQPVPHQRRSLRVRPSRVDALLGVAVSRDEMIRLLRAIGFEVEEVPSSDETVLDCVVPTFRPDVEREVDVIEEIARLYGYDRVPEPARSVVPFHAPRDAPEARLRQTARSLLSGLGYREIYTNSMLRREVAERFLVEALHASGGNGADRPDDKNLHASGGNGADRADGGTLSASTVVETLNPISREMAAMRPSLLPGMLQVLAFNSKHGQRMLRFFESGHVFRRADEKADTLIPGYAEGESLILAAFGEATASGWDTDARPADFFDVKGVAESLLEALHVPHVHLRAHYGGTPITSHHLEVLSGDAHAGIIAEVGADVLEEYDLPGPVYFAELDWQTIVAVAAPHLDRRYVRVSRFPVVERDLSVIVDQDREAGPMLLTIRDAGRGLLQRVEIFDLYEGELIGAGKKSIAFSLRFGGDRTLTDEEVDERVTAILQALNEAHGAELRGPATAR